MVALVAVEQIDCINFTFHLSLPSLIPQGGVYVQQIFEWYCGGRILLLMVFLQCVGIAYFYGKLTFVW